MTKRLYDELKADGVDPEKFLAVYKIIRATPEIDLPLLEVPGIGNYELKEIFSYMSEKVGLLTKQDGKYTVSSEGIDVMEAKVKAGELKKPFTDKVREKIPKRHGE